MAARVSSEGGPAIRVRFNWRLLVTVVSALLIVAGGLYGTRHYLRQSRARRGLASGEEAYRARDWRNAAKGLGQYVARYPNDTRVLLRYAEAHLGVWPRQRANVDQAVAVYRQILRGDPTHQQAALRVSEIYVGGGMPGEAEMILTRRLEADAHDTGALLLRAQARRDLRKWKDAAADLRAVIAADPGTIAAYALLADLMRERPADVPGDPLKDALRPAVERNPASALAHVLLGSALDRLDSPDARKEAAAEYQKALECDLSRPLDRVALARWRLAVGDVRGAETQLEAAASGPEPHLLSIWLLWAEVARLKGRPDEASRLADRALAALGPERFPFLPNAVELYLLAVKPAEADVAKAERCLKAYREALPGSRLVQWLEGQMALARDQAADAVRLFKTALEAAQRQKKEIGFGTVPPEVERDLMRIPLALAWARVQAKDLESAIEVLKDFLRQYPDHPAGLSRLAALYEQTHRKAVEDRNDKLAQERKALALDAHRRMYDRDRDSRLGLALYVGALRRMGEPQEADRLLDQAAERSPTLASVKLEDELRRGQLTDAIETVADMLRYDPQNADLKVFQASLMMRGGRFDDARAVLQGLDEKADINVALASIDLLMYENKPEDALPRCNALVERLPQNVAARLMRARVRERAGTWDLALEDHRALFDIKPDALQSWTILSDFFVRYGRDLIRKGDYAAARTKYEEALKAVEECLKKDPKFEPAVTQARALRDGGASLLFARDLLARNTRDAAREAATVLNDLAHQRPDWTEARYMTAAAALSAGEVDAALEAVRAALKADLPAPQKRALLLMKAGAEMLVDPAQAVATLEPLRQENPGDLTLALRLARACRDAGRGVESVRLLDEALAAVKTAAAAAPDDPRHVARTVEILALAGRFAEAETAVDDWRKRRPEDLGTVLAVAEMLLAGGAELEGRPAPDDQKAGREAIESARRILSAALQGQPQNARIKVQLATACQVAGDLDQAEKLYREALAQLPGHLVSLNNLAWLLSEERNKPAEALQLCESAREAFPPFVALLDTRGVILRRLGRLDEARKVLEECVRVAPPLGSSGAMARLHVAQVLADQGEKDRARDVLKDLLARPPRAGGLPAKDRKTAENLLKKVTE